MAIEGDIDLTQKLDFRVDKQKKQLPSTQLRSNNPKSMKSLAENKDPRFSFCPATLHGSSKYWCSNYTSTENNITIYSTSLDTSSTTSFISVTAGTYPVCTTDNSYIYIPDSYTQNIYATSSNDVTIWNIKYNIDPQIEASVDFSLNTKKEKDYSLNKHHYGDEEFILGDKRMVEIHEPTIEAFRKPAEDEYYIPYAFNSYYYEYEEDDDDSYNWMYYSDSFDRIPWFDKMRNTRIRQDYIDSLNDKEQNFDSYLTNYSWLGLH